MYAFAVFTALIAAATAAPMEARATYKTYKGDGSTAQGWPAKSAWTTFDAMWSGNLNMIQNSCSLYKAANTSPAEAAELKTAIQNVAKSTGVDERFILAVVMQESKGCVRVWQTTSPGAGVNNPGLMQDHNGAHKCNTAVGVDGVQSVAGQLTTPCPADQITGMIQDGAGGTSAGDGLKQTIAKAGGSDAQTIYKAARIYNAGSLSSTGQLGAPGATPAYCSDIANRLQGVVFDASPYTG